MALSEPNSLFPTAMKNLDPACLMHRNSPRSWMLIVLAAMAGGMGWGIRGQYGHQTGAMLAGLLVGLVLVLFLVPAWSAISGARVVACLTLGISLGGSMTYGQTVGLTHDAALIGNWDALRWGLLGLFIKGGTWIGLAGLFLGLALSDTRYRASELALLLMVAVFIRILGIQLLNEPYRPDEQLLPTLYFSDHWFWEPGQEDKKDTARLGVKKSQKIGGKFVRNFDCVPSSLCGLSFRRFAPDSS